MINHYTAWYEQSGLRENIERAFPSVKVYYRECEPANCVCSTNDTIGMYFPESYCLASFDNKPEYFMTIGEAARYVSEIVRKRVPSKMKAIYTMP